MKSPGADNGSIFILHLPLKITHSHPDNPGRTHPSAERVAAPEYQSTNRVGLKVLVVDDQADANELLGRVLEDSGAIAFPASSAVEGLDVLRREQPDVLGSDIGMPGVDGYEFCERWRQPTEGGSRL